MHNNRFSKPFFGRTLVGLLATGASLTCASSASASGFITARFGGEHGTPTTDSPTAIYYNPAGLADRDPGVEKAPFEFHVFADANLAWIKSSFSHSAVKGDSPEPTGAQGANNGEATLTNFAASPMAGVNFKIGDFAVGAAFSVPFGGQQSWDKNKKFTNNKNFAGPVDGVQRWSTISGESRSIYISLGAAYDIVKRFSIGASVNLVASSVKTLRAREPGGTNDIDVEGRSIIDVKGMNGSFGVGVLVNYRSKVRTYHRRLDEDERDALSGMAPES